MTSLPRRALRALFCAASLAATTAQGAGALQDDKKQALAEFIAAYRLADAWPRMVPKIARDSLPRLEDAIHADLDGDKFPDAESAAAAHARVPGLLGQGRRELEASLQAFDADELAAYVAYEIYAKYLTTDEIREITAFFDSDTGRKLTALPPALLSESRQSANGDVMARHFEPTELAAIAAFRSSPAGRKMNETALQVRDEMHAHFIERSEPSLQALARRLATKAETETGRSDSAGR